MRAGLFAEERLGTPARGEKRFQVAVQKDAAGIPLLAGFLIMLWDDRRRCLQDRLARTVVVDAPVEEGPGVRR